MDVFGKPYIWVDSATNQVYFTGTGYKTLSLRGQRYEFAMDAAEPEMIYDAVAPLIDRLLRDYQQPYSIYWNDYEGDVLNPMLFFTNDGGMIVGLTVREDGAYSPEFYLDALTKSVDGRGGVITWETPPPLNEGEFVEWVKEITA